MVNDQDYVAIFHSIHRVLSAEQVLKRDGVSFLLIPVPRQLTSDCGLALRIAPLHLAAVFAVLAAADLLPAELYQLRTGEYAAVAAEAIGGSAGTA